MHEIVTLQFGQQSNYLGTHFWNIQVRMLYLIFFCAALAVYTRSLKYPCSPILIFQCGNNCCTLADSYSKKVLFCFVSCCQHGFRPLA